MRRALATESPPLRAGAHMRTRAQDRWAHGRWRECDAHLAALAIVLKTFVAVRDVSEGGASTRGSSGAEDRDHGWAGVGFRKGLLERVEKCAESGSLKSCGFQGRVVTTPKIAAPFFSRSPARGQSDRGTHPPPPNPSHLHRGRAAPSRTTSQLIPCARASQRPLSTSAAGQLGCIISSHHRTAWTPMRSR